MNLKNSDSKLKFCASLARNPNAKISSRKARKERKETQRPRRRIPTLNNLAENL